MLDAYYRMVATAAAIQTLNIAKYCLGPEKAHVFGLMVKYFLTEAKSATLPTSDQNSESLAKIGLTYTAAYIVLSHPHTSTVMASGMVYILANTQGNLNKAEIIKYIDENLAAPENFSMQKVTTDLLNSVMLAYGRIVTTIGFAAAHLAVDAITILAATAHKKLKAE